VISQSCGIAESVTQEFIALAFARHAAKGHDLLVEFLAERINLDMAMAQTFDAFACFSIRILHAVENQLFFRVMVTVREVGHVMEYVPQAFQVRLFACFHQLALLIKQNQQTMRVFVLIYDGNQH